jgi:hypothetical protein
MRHLKRLEVARTESPAMSVPGVKMVLGTVLVFLGHPHPFLGSPRLFLGAKLLPGTCSSFPGTLLIVLGMLTVGTKTEDDDSRNIVPGERNS